jgi:hypothetical protein
LDPGNAAGWRGAIDSSIFYLDEITLLKCNWSLYGVSGNIEESAGRAI